MSPCIVSDTSSTPNDALYVVGLSGPEPTDDCQGRPITVGKRPVLVVVAPPADADLRDILDRGLAFRERRRPDVLLTRDPDVAAYATRGADYFAVPLPWDRPYVVVG